MEVQRPPRRLLQPRSVHPWEGHFHLGDCTQGIMHLVLPLEGMGHPSVDPMDSKLLGWVTCPQE